MNLSNEWASRGIIPFNDVSDAETNREMNYYHVIGTNVEKNVMQIYGDEGMGMSHGTW